MVNLSDFAVDEQVDDPSTSSEWAVRVTRQRRGVPYARGIVAGPYTEKLDATRARDRLAASDGNSPLGRVNPDSVWEVVPHEPCRACQSEKDIPESEHTC